jgi:peptide/nickel transport system permease protein
MLRHIAGHMAQAVLLLISVVVLIFCLLQLIPGDPIQAMVGDMPVPPALRASLEQRFQLNEPFLQRLYGYLVNVLHGDLGYSMNYRRPVFDILAERFPRTLLLAGVGYAFGLLIGITIGIQSAVTPHRSVDQAWSSLVLIGYAMPTFWVGQLLVMVFSIHLGWLPTQGMGPMISRTSGVDWLLERATYLVLPVATYTILETTRVARFMRASVRETLEQGYIVTARQKGLSRREIIMGHVVRNSILPVITVMGYSFGTAMGGAVLLETVFSYPGVGSLMVEAVRARDTQVIVGVVILIACSVVFMNIVVDLLYAWLDPRIRFSSAQR